MSEATSTDRSPALWLATALLVGAAALLLIGGLVMGIGMADWMGGGHMGGMMSRAGNSPQTPVVAGQAQTSVEIRNYEFFPRDLTVDAGARVTWTNRDSAPHSATNKGGWDTGLLQQDESATLTFDTPGAYDYFCLVHPNMKATLTVR